jgi:hypothetical protein
MLALCLSHCCPKHLANVQLEVSVFMNTKPSYDIIVYAPCMCLKRTSKCTFDSSLACSACKFSYTDFGATFESCTTSSGFKNDDEVSFSAELNAMEEL